jgi:hypothetical protein
MKTTVARMLFFSASFALLCGPSQAGDGNRIYVLQERTNGNGGNTLSVDQSNANDSLVRGPLQGANQSLEAKQLGGDNKATLVIDGNGGTIQLLQSNPATEPGNGNTANVGLSGSGTALVSQIGSLNGAKLNVSGDLAKGSIVQTGDLNQAELKVEGSGASGSVTQDGNNNVTSLNVTGAGTSVNYTLNGSNLTTVPGSGVQVYTNGATVTITQSAF